MVYQQISKEKKNKRHTRGVEQQVEQCRSAYWDVRNVCTGLNLKLYSEMWEIENAVVAKSGVRLPKTALRQNLPPPS